MCWAARRVEYMSIAATAVNSLPVSPRLMTRLNRQQHATADRHWDSAADEESDTDDDFITDELDDDDSSISSWYSESTYNRTIPMYLNTHKVNYNKLHNCIRIQSLMFKIDVQGSHSFTDKKSRTFPGPQKSPWQIFQDLFGAHKCWNIKKKLFPLLLTPVLPPLPFP